MPGFWGACSNKCQGRLWKRQGHLWEVLQYVHICENAIVIASPRPRLFGQTCCSILLWSVSFIAQSLMIAAVWYVLILSWCYSVSVICHNPYPIHRLLPDSLMVCARSSLLQWVPQCYVEFERKQWLVCVFIVSAICIYERDKFVKAVLAVTRLSNNL